MIFVLTFDWIDYFHDNQRNKKRLHLNIKNNNENETIEFIIILTCLSYLHFFFWIYFRSTKNWFIFMSFVSLIFFFINLFFSLLISYKFSSFFHLEFIFSLMNTNNLLFISSFFPISLRFHFLNHKKSIKGNSIIHCARRFIFWAETKTFSMILFWMFSNWLHKEHNKKLNF